MKQPPEGVTQYMADIRKLSPARNAALNILRRVQTENAYAANLLASGTTDALSPADRRLTYELVLGVLRWQLQLDFLIERLSGRSIGKLDLDVLLALRLGIYQLRFLSRIPNSAAVNESVELVKRSGFKSATGFVNALLRKAIKESDNILASLDSDTSDHLAVKVSHPQWLIDKWISQFGVDATKELAAANNQSPSTTFRFNSLKHDAEETKRILMERGIEFTAGDLCSNAFRITSGSPGDVRDLADSGAIYFQDEASQLVASIVDAKPGERILDLCAAPGSKTTLLAVDMDNSGEIIAGDLHNHRLAVLDRTCGILGVENVRPVALDARQRLPFGDEIKFDRVLIDAPCSGTGTLRHNPEIKWRLTSERISELSSLQSQILGSAAERIKPGARLVYSTCSLEREENEDVIKRFLHDHTGFELQQPKNINQTVITNEGFIRTFPNRHQCDGFFAAVLRKSD